MFLQDDVAEDDVAVFLQDDVVSEDVEDDVAVFSEDDVAVFLQDDEQQELGDWQPPRTATREEANKDFFKKKNKKQTTKVGKRWTNKDALHST